MAGQATDRYEMLDGLRGVAAIAVLVLHTRQAFGGDHIFGHAYLAVDFFFILSGFVLTRAYADRLERPGGLRNFLVDRAIRLWPLIILATLLGTVARILAGADWDQAMISGVTNALMLPIPGSDDPFVSDGVLWSLFWELFINGLFALAIVRRVGSWRAGLLCVSGVAMLIVIGVHGSFDVGSPETALILGAPRAGLGFAIGALMARTAPAPSDRSETRIWLAPLLLLTFTLIPNKDGLAILYDPICVLVLFPMLVALAARTRPRFSRLAKLSGDMSFPLYVLHSPILALFTVIWESRSGTPVSPLITQLLVCAMIPISILAARYYDEPARRWMRRALQGLRSGAESTGLTQKAPTAT
jgi:peptidoglycan/LPS O-acetylase OafA/YrhL